jgi:CO dehydrogenase/acetyl-CoA synthase beta subunit
LRWRQGACLFGRHPYHDHWVCEYWARDEQRWVLVDAELDELHRSLLKFDFDPTDGCVCKPGSQALCPALSERALI